jgi:thiol-disulfide isomerase/thioredoxin
MKKISLTILLLTVVNVIYSQENYLIKGFFTNIKDKEIRLLGYLGTKDTILSQTKINLNGNFTLSYPEKYVGAATIQVKDLSNLVVILNHENFNLEFSDFKNLKTLKYKYSLENEKFEMGNRINFDCQNKLLGLDYLLPLYEKDEVSKGFFLKIKEEIQYQNNIFNAFQNQLNSSLYCKDYFKYLMILQKIQKNNKAIHYDITNEINFLTLDFNDNNLFHSGLVKELITEYLQQLFILQNKNSIIEKMNFFSNHLKNSLVNNPKLLHQYTEYLIKEYEKYGFSEAAEFLAISVLNDNKCKKDDKISFSLEQYKKMAIGNTAPRLEITNNPKYKVLSEINSKYKIVVFGASWCEECKKEIPQLKEYCSFFKIKYDAEIVFFSIDTDKNEYFNFSKDLPFINSCDFKGWGSENVKNYNIIATPTIVIIDKNNKIVAKPMDAIETASWLYNN